MAENLVGQFISKGPYLHSKAYNFRSGVHTKIHNTGFSNSNIVDDLRGTIDRLTALSRQLQSGADIFLQPWGGSYKKASQELFGNNKSQNKEVQYRKTLLTILNSQYFIDLINSNCKIEIDEQKLETVLLQHGIKSAKSAFLENLTTEKQIEKFVDHLIKQIMKSSKNKGGSSRIYIDGFENVLSTVAGITQQQYFQNKKTLAKALQTGLVKQSKKVDWAKIYGEVRKKFLSYFSNDVVAMAYIDGLEKSFISQGRKLKAIDNSNISGFILENMAASVINHSDLQVHVYDLGDSTEEEIVKLASEISNGIPKISPMDYKGASATQSGTDWILVNSKGNMVRAQAKNSVTLAEEFEKEGAISKPAQTLKLQDGIKYRSLQENIKQYSKGTGGLTDEDWQFLDYLIVNILWIRAGGAVTKDRGGNYASGVSGIQALINQLLTKEINYFLGVQLDLDQQEEAIEAVIGASNLFFVIDGLVLYPTYKIINNILLQLRAIEGSVAKIYVTLGNDFVKPTNLAEKSRYKQPGWRRGDPYSEGVLEVGREAGNLILDTLKIQRVNLNVNINEILQTVYSTVLV